MLHAAEGGCPRAVSVLFLPPFLASFTFNLQWFLEFNSMFYSYMKGLSEQA